MPYVMAFDHLKVEVDSEPDCSVVLLGYADAVQIAGIKNNTFPMQEGIQFSLVDVHIDPVRRCELAEVVFPELADVHDDTRERRMCVVTEVVDLDPGVRLSE